MKLSKPKLSIIKLSIILLMSIILTQVTAAEIELPKQLTLNSTVPAPLHTIDGKGCFDEYIKMIFSELNIEINFVELPAKRALELINQGQIDGDIARYGGVEKDYANLIRVPVPIYNSRLILVSSQPITDDVNSILETEKVGVILSAQFINSYVSPENQVITHSYKQLLDLINEKRLRYGYLPADTLLGLEKALKVNFYTRFPQNQKGIDVFILLNKKHTSLIPKLVNIMSRPGSFEAGSPKSCKQWQAKVNQKYPN